jgi:hypothetical protein
MRDLARRGARMEDAYVVALLALFAMAYVGQRVESAWERHSARMCSARVIECMWTNLNELGRTATIVTGWHEWMCVMREWTTRLSSVSEAVGGPTH